MRSGQLLAPVLSLLCSSAFAGSPAKAPVPVEEPAPASEIELRAISSYVLEGDFDQDGMGGTDTVELRTTVTWRRMLTDHWRLSLGAGYGRYDFPGANGAPIPDALQQTFGVVGLEYLVKGRPALFLSTRPGFFYTDSIDSDTFDIPAVLAVGFPIRKGLVGSVGALYSNFRDTPFIPIAGLIWDISDRVTLNLMAPEPSLIYRTEGGTEFSLKGEFTGTTVHLGDDLPEPYAEENLDYMDFRAGLGVRFGGNRRWSADIDAGWSFLRRLQYDDLDEDYDLDGAPYVKVRFTCSF